MRGENGEGQRPAAGAREPRPAPREAQPGARETRSGPHATRPAGRGQRVLRVIYGSWLNLIGLVLLLLPQGLAGPRVAQIQTIALDAADALGLLSIGGWTLWLAWALAGDLSRQT